MQNKITWKRLETDKHTFVGNSGTSVYIGTKPDKPQDYQEGNAILSTSGPRVFGNLKNTNYNREDCKYLYSMRFLF